MNSRLVGYATIGGAIGDSGRVKKVSELNVTVEL
jgi:hypothetical protein